MRLTARKLGLGAALGVTLLMAVVAVAYAGTGLESGDVAIIGAASTSANPANLECGGAAVNIQLDVTANDGNLPSSQATQGFVTVPQSLTINGTGVTAVT